MRIFRILLIFLLIVAHSLVIKSTPDELSKAYIQLQQSITIQDSIDAIFELCDLFSGSFSKKDSLLKYAVIARDLADKNGDEELILESRIFFGNAHSLSDSLIYFTEMMAVRDGYLSKGDYLRAARRSSQMGMYFAYSLKMDSIRKYKHQALDYLENVENRDEEFYDLKTLILYYIANSYHFGDSYESALSYALEMKDISEAQQLEKRTLMSYQLLGIIYNGLDIHLIVDNDYREKAEAYLTKAYELSLASDATEVQYGSAFRLGQFLYTQERYTEALPYLEESLKITQSVGNVAYEFNNSIYLGKTFLELGEISKALDFCKRSDELTLKYEMGVNERSVSMLYAVIYNEQKNYPLALSYAEKAFNHPTTIGNAELRAEGLRLLEDITYNDGLYKQSRSYDKRADQLEDSLFNAKTLGRMELVQNKYDLLKQKEEIESLQNLSAIESLEFKNKIITYSGVFVLILGCLLGYLLLQKSQKEKREKELIALEQRLLRSQMNPHFIFNAISSIQNFLYDKEDLNTALNYMSKFGKLMRQVLENSREEYISLSEEINSLRNYLDMQLLRYNQKFDYRINVSEELESDLLLVPPLITQPFVENAIEHGMIYSIEGGKVTIDISKREGMLSLSIKDNGVGKRNDIDYLELPIKKKKSLAAIMTQERLNHLSYDHKRKFMMTTKLLEEGGMMVHINLPIIRGI